MTDERQKAFDLALGRRIRARRRALRMTQSDLGLSVGVSFQQIHKYETGASSISAARLAFIAEQLEAPLSYFLAEQARAEAA